MEGTIRALFQNLLAILLVLVISVRGQISTPCTTSAITTFTPCFNYLTGSTANGSTPTGDCCNALRSLTGTNMDCVCLIVTANVPFQIPIIQTLALGLPRACNMASVPLQCKAAGSPLPAPGPAQLRPTLPPTADAPFSPQASKAAAAAAASPALPPADETTIAPSPPVEPEAPTAHPKIRPVSNPAAASDASQISSSSSSLALIIFIGMMMMLICY